MFIIFPPVCPLPFSFAYGGFLGAVKIFFEVTKFINLFLYCFCLEILECLVTLSDTYLRPNQPQVYISILLECSSLMFL